MMHPMRNPQPMAPFPQPPQQLQALNPPSTEMQQNMYRPPISASNVPIPGPSMGVSAAAPMETPAETAMAEWEARIQTVFEDHVGGSVLEMYFADLMVPPTPDMLVQRKCDAVNELVSLLRNVPPDLTENVFRLILKHRSKSESAHSLARDTVESVLQAQILPLKNACESLLGASDCILDNPSVWLETFKFLDSHVPKLDYKGVRDVLKVLLERIQSIPVHLHPDQRTLVEAAEKFGAKICDRKNNLLPAYFVINEIKKNYPDHRCFPHWRMAKLCTDVIDSFRPLAQLVSVVGRAQMVPVAGHIGLHLNTSWKMDSTILRFPFKGVLPYSLELTGPQHYLLYQALMQGNGYRELLSAILYFPKTEKARCQMLEDIVVSIILEVMAESEREGRQFRIVWRIVAGLIVYLTNSQIISFPRLVLSLQQKLTTLPYRKARDQLMWCLLQYLSWAIQKAAPEEFFCVLDLYRVLYSGNDKFTVSSADSSITFALAAACTWTHMTHRTQRKNQTGTGNGAELDVPPSISSQIQFLQENLKNKKQWSDSYTFAVLCNAYSTTTEIFQDLMATLAETLELGRSGPNTPTSSVSLPGGLLAENRCTPLKYEFLDAITVHVRVHLLHHLYSQNFVQYLHRKSALSLSPACVETYGRLLSYMDFEPQGLKTFLQLPSLAVKASCLEGVHIAVEIFLYRIHQVPLSHRVQAAAIIQQVCSTPASSSNHQLYALLDNALIRLLFWCPPNEILQPLYTRLLTMMAASVPQDAHRLMDNEEVVKVVVLSLARSLVIAGADNTTEYRDLIARFRAHSWSSSILRLFPSGFELIYASQAPPMPLMQKESILQQQVRDELMKWRTLGNEGSLMDHFSRSPHQVFLCLLYHLLANENSELPPVAIRVLEALGPRTVNIQLQTLVDYVLIDCQRRNTELAPGADYVNKMIWKYGCFSLDRFILTTVLRHYEGQDALLALCLVMVVIQRSPDQLHARIAECAATLPADHWHCQDWHEKHTSYHQKFPERYWPIVLHEMTRTAPPPSSVMPVYFSNACFSLLPALDLLILRLLNSMPTLQRFFDPLITIVGPLYKYHPHPVMFLYTTFRFYEKKLMEITPYRQRLLLLIHNAFASSRGETWLISSDFLHYLHQHQQPDTVSWIPDLDYFAQLVKRFVDCLAQPLLTPQWIKIDWRFSEFSGCQTHALYALCIELMALPTAPADVGTSLVNILLQGHPAVFRREMTKWTNALGLIFTALPLSYVQALYDALTNVLCSDEVINWKDVFVKSNVEQQTYLYEDSVGARLLATAHAVWQHATIGYLMTLPQLVRERWRPLVTAEVQFFFVCHLVCPFMLRLHQERSKQAMEVATDIYEMLLCVDKGIPEWRYEDIVCDLLYHMKYMFVGQGIRPETDRVIPLLRPSLQDKLRFINQQVDAVGTGTA